MLVTLDFGTQVDMLNKGELQEALAEDARIRALVTGVKPVDAFFGASLVQGPVATFTTPVSMVGAGLYWAVMNIGFENATATFVRVYKNGSPPATPNGQGRFVAQASSAISTSVQLSKGQLMLRGGDQLVFNAGTTNLLSAFISAIEIPAERVGELLL